MKDTLYIGGGFDVLHDGHRKFIQFGIDAFRTRFGDLSNLIIGIKSDQRLNNQKGTLRPFFTFDWRKEDLESFLDSLNLDSQISVIDSTTWETLIDTSKTVFQVVNGGKLNGFSDFGDESLIRTDSGMSVHTSNIEQSLVLNQDNSKCDVRKVGATLTRNGEIISVGSSGTKGCLTCPKGEAYKQGGGKLSKGISCNSPHAEIVCLEESIPGDDLFITDSPCMSCAIEIKKKGIRRVVYRDKYYDTKPIEYLKQEGIDIRMMGIEK